jgi:hypothetical protein
VFWSTTLIFLNRRFEALDRAWYQWECVRCFRSLAQTLSRRHHDRFSSFCEKKVSRRRSKSCFVENRIRFEFCREEKEENEKKKKTTKKIAKEKENEKNEKKKEKNENNEIDDDDEKNDDVDVRIVQIVVNKQFEIQISIIIDKRSSRFIKK